MGSSSVTRMVASLVPMPAAENTRSSPFGKLIVAAYFNRAWSRSLAFPVSATNVRLVRSRCCAGDLGVKDPRATTWLLCEDASASRVYPHNMQAAKGIARKALNEAHQPTSRCWSTERSVQRRTAVFIEVST